MKVSLIIFSVVISMFLVTYTYAGKLECIETINNFQQKPGSKLPDRDFKEMFMSAQELFDYNIYEEALKIFLTLLSSDRNNCNINFYVGVCYLNLKIQQTKAIDYFEKAILKTDVAYSYNYKETSAPVFAYMYLGQAQCLSGKYTEGLANYEKFKSYLTDKPKDAKFLKEVTRNIEMANNAIKQTASPVKVTIEPYKNANSVLSDYAPILSSDTTKFYFTSKRKGSMGGQKDNLGELLADIYQSQRKNGVWSKPKKMGNKMNTVNDDELNCISANDSQMYISRNPGNSFDIFVSELSKKGKWLPPKKLEKVINGKDNEKCTYISPDTKYLLFASDRAGGYGGYDLYISQKEENGNWGKPENLGPEINTEYDELWPVLISDGTLYFSSKGHETMGGFDIFQSTMSGMTSWSMPVNMGYPLNTPFDDISFSPSSDLKTGYYASGRKVGFGDTDIYKYTFK